MTRAEREALSQRICNFYYDSTKKSVKTTVNYFKKQDVPQSTIYYVLKKRRISLSTIRVFPGSIRPTTDSNYGDTGSR